MEKCLSVAKLLCNAYESRFGKAIDEMKAHKLMYFAQRESFILFGEPLFDEYFEGWRFGPVLVCVRDEFRSGHFHKIVPCSSPRAKEIIKTVVERFGALSSWTLSSLSHQEVSWRLARVGLDASDNGRTTISNDAIKIDAAREKAARGKIDK